MIRSSYLILSILLELINFAVSQGGAYNYAKTTSGERFGDLSPVEIAVVCVAVLAFAGGLVVTAFFCYYVHKKQRDDMSVSVFTTTKHIPLSTDYI